MWPTPKLCLPVESSWPKTRRSWEVTRIEDGGGMVMWELCSHGFDFCMQRFVLQYLRSQCCTSIAIPIPRIINTAWCIVAPKGLGFDPKIYYLKTNIICWPIAPHGPPADDHSYIHLFGPIFIHCVICGLSPKNSGFGNFCIRILTIWVGKGKIVGPWGLVETCLN